MSCDGFHPAEALVTVTELNETYEEEMWTRDWLDMFHRYEDAEEASERRSLCLQLKAMWTEYMDRETEGLSP